MERKEDVIRQQIEELSRRERELEMELEDVLTDVTSAENSDDDEVHVHEEHDDVVRIFKHAILLASGQPSAGCNFRPCYEDPQYRERVEKKMKKLKKIVQTANIQAVLQNPTYGNHLRRIQGTYPVHGGRELLNELVAVYCTLEHNN